MTLRQSFEYLSLCFGSYLCVVRPADHLLDKLLQDLAVLSNQIHVTPRELQSFLGLINFLAPLDLGRLHMCPIQFWLSAHWNHSHSSIDLPLPVTLELKETLEAWVDAAWLLQGVPMLSPSPDVYLCTDSSLEAWRATLNEKDVSKFWRGSQRSLHSNRLEILTVKFALQHFRSEIQSCTVLFLCDNATIVTHLRKEKGLVHETSVSSHGGYCRFAGLGRLAC